MDWHSVNSKGAGVVLDCCSETEALLLFCSCEVDRKPLWIEAEINLLHRKTRLTFRESGRSPSAPLPQKKEASCNRLNIW